MHLRSDVSVLYVSTADVSLACLYSSLLLTLDRVDSSNLWQAIDILVMIYISLTWPWKAPSSFEISLYILGRADRHIDTRREPWMDRGHTFVLSSTHCDP